MPKYKCYWAEDKEFVEETPKKMVRVSLTPDAAINREALEQLDMIDMMNELSVRFGAKMVAIEVEQGSEAAEIITQARTKYLNEVDKDT